MLQPVHHHLQQLDVDPAAAVDPQPDLGVDDLLRDRVLGPVQVDRVNLDEGVLIVDLGGLGQKHPQIGRHDPLRVLPELVGLGEVEVEQVGGGDGVRQGVGGGCANKACNSRSLIAYFGRFSLMETRRKEGGVEIRSAAHLEASAVDGVFIGRLIEIFFSRDGD